MYSFGQLCSTATNFYFDYHITYIMWDYRFKRKKSVMVQLVPVVLWWSLSSLTQQLEGATFPGLFLSTPDPSVHQRTPVPNQFLIRNVFKEVPDKGSALDHYSCYPCYIHPLSTECVALFLAKPSTVLVPCNRPPRWSFGSWVSPVPPVFPPDGAFWFFFPAHFK